MEQQSIILGAAVGTAFVSGSAVLLFSRLRRRKQIELSGAAMFLSTFLLAWIPEAGAVVFAIGGASAVLGFGFELSSLSGLAVVLGVALSISPAALWLVPLYSLGVLIALAHALAHLLNYRGQEHLGLVREIIGSLCVREVREEVIQVLLHDVRTPLTGIKGSAQAMIEIPDMERETQVEFLKIIDQEVNSLAHLVRELGDALKQEIPPGMSAEETLQALKDSLRR